MKPLVRAEYPPEAFDPGALMKRFGHLPGMTAEAASHIAARNRAAEIYQNDVYEVMKSVEPSKDGGPDMIHLSIKRRDKAPVHDWRDLQEIKNQLADPEYEAVELYPSESRRVDSANQFHLWCVCSKTFRFPFGFNSRLVLDAGVAEQSGGRQRAFDPDGESA